MRLAKFTVPSSYGRGREGTTASRNAHRESPCTKDDGLKGTQHAAHNTRIL